MKVIFSVLLFLLVVASANAADLSEESIQGRWYITKVGDLVVEEAELDEDVWEFKGNQYIVHSSGISLRPDKFSIEGDAIKFDYYSINVTEFTGDSMVTDIIGIVQELKKEE